PAAGFILPTTLLVMTLLTVMLTAGFIMASAEFRASDNSLSNSRALSLAQAGMENYFSLQRLLDTTSTYDSVRITFSNGYADVVGRRVRKNTGSHLPLWLVRSIGTSTDPKQPGQPQGQRAVAQMAELNAGLIPARAAITAINGIQMVAGGTTNNPIIGADNNYGSSVPGCTKPGGGLADTAAYTVGSAPQTFSITAWGTATGYARSTGSFINDGFAIGQTVVASGFAQAANNGFSTVTNVAALALTVSKSPQTLSGSSASGRTISVVPGNYLGGSPTPTQTQQSFAISVAYDSSHVDWQRVLNGDFSPDYVGTLPPAGNSTYYSYYWAGNVTIPTGQQRGLLVASGNVTLSNGSHWDGIIIAGGRLVAVPGTSNSYLIHGMVITGLNCVLGACPAGMAQDSIQRGGSNQINWDWCYTHAAIGGLNGLVPIKNTWVDTWSLY
ncbi:MAG: hypothetical protein ACHQU8_09745, partial [Gemmatimonadales bacterium]